MKILQAFGSTVVFVLCLFAFYYVHISFFGVNVVFYAATADGIFAAAATGTVLFFTQCFGALGQFEKTLLVVVFALGGYAFAISVPTVIDRSLSFYILEKLQQRGGAIRADRFTDVFTNEYMNEYKLVDIRLTEQAQSGTITIENGCVKITPKGAMIAAGSHYFRTHLLPKRRLLNGTYTDVLTDPFRNSIESPDYQCQ